jgi:hypothetical protein
VLNNRIRTALVVLAASAGLGACTNFGPYGGVGVGVGSGYGGYGGYGSPYGYGYGSPYYGYNRYPTYGWYDGFYYPGRGYWVYDPGGHAHPITDKQKSYWGGVLAKAREARGTAATAEATENWSGFSTQGKVAAPVTAGGSAQADEPSRRQIFEARRQQRLERQQSQAETRQTRSESSSSSPRQILRERAARRSSQPGGE